jgi:hypothetical protein
VSVLFDVWLSFISVFGMIIYINIVFQRCFSIIPVLKFSDLQVAQMKDHSAQT